MIYPPSVANLIESFKSLPGIGPKSAERLVLTLINFDDQILEEFANNIIDVKNSIKRCQMCNNISENSICDICANEQRDQQTIFVVENIKDIIAFEKLKIYHGVYHVLDGLISPIDGISPNDIRITELVTRIDKNGVKELIFALKPNIEGETTILYIKKILGNNCPKISKIASGIPMGVDLEYIDGLTLSTALEERKNIV